MGFSKTFISGIRLSLPEIPEALHNTRASLIDDPDTHELDYTHFSVVMHKERRLAWFAATNIDGRTWDASVTERLVFTKDDRIDAEHQTGNELYDVVKDKANNDFDKGHIAKFQDPQWGDEETRQRAADDSMKYTNCLPQHHSLNRGAWKSLEDYIIKKFTVIEDMDGQKISVFAGPVLSPDDPLYFEKIEGKPYQVPCHFWKVIVFKNLNKKHTAVAFLMSQSNILKEKGFIKKKTMRGGPAVTARPEFFTDFTKGEPYQVSINFIEKITGLNFNLDEVNQPYTKEEAKELIFKRTEVKVGGGKKKVTRGGAAVDDTSAVVVEVEIDGMVM